MARCDLRTVENKSGAAYDAGDTDRIFAEDIEAIKDAIDDATTGINTNAVEVGGNEKIDSSGNFVKASSITNAGATIVLGDASGTRFEIDNSGNTIKLYINDVLKQRWKA